MSQDSTLPPGSLTFRRSTPSRPDRAASAGVRPGSHWPARTLLRQQTFRAPALDPATPSPRRAARSEQAHSFGFRLQDPSGTGISQRVALWLAKPFHSNAADPRPDFSFRTVLRKAPTNAARPGLTSPRRLFATSQADKARTVPEDLHRLLPSRTGTSHVRSPLMLVDLIIAFRDTDTAQATYDLFYPLAPRAVWSAPAS